MCCKKTDKRNARSFLSVADKEGEVEEKQDTGSFTLARGAEKAKRSIAGEKIKGQKQKRYKFKWRACFTENMLQKLRSAAGRKFLRRCPILI